MVFVKNKYIGMTMDTSVFISQVSPSRMYTTTDTAATPSTTAYRYLDAVCQTKFHRSLAAVLERWCPPPKPRHNGHESFTPSQHAARNRAHKLHLKEVTQRVKQEHLFLEAEYRMFCTTKQYDTVAHPPVLLTFLATDATLDDKVAKIAMDSVNSWVETFEAGHLVYKNDPQWAQRDAIRALVECTPQRSRIENIYTGSRMRAVFWESHKRDNWRRMQRFLQLYQDHCGTDAWMCVEWALFSPNKPRPMRQDIVRVLTAHHATRKGAPTCLAGFLDVCPDVYAADVVQDACDYAYERMLDTRAHLIGEGKRAGQLVRRPYANTLSVLQTRGWVPRQSLGLTVRTRHAHCKVTQVEAVHDEMAAARKVRRTLAATRDAPAARTTPHHGVSQALTLTLPRTDNTEAALCCVDARDLCGPNDTYEALLRRCLRVLSATSVERASVPFEYGRVVEGDGLCEGYALSTRGKHVHIYRPTHPMVHTDAFDDAACRYVCTLPWTVFVQDYWPLQKRRAQHAYTWDGQSRSHEVDGADAVERVVCAAVE